MYGRLQVEDIKSVMKRVGVEGVEAEKAMAWRHPMLNKPLSGKDDVVAELTVEEQAFLRSVGYVLYKNKSDPLRRKALVETFWIAVRIFHDLPCGTVSIKEGKYLVN